MGKENLWVGFVADYMAHFTSMALDTGLSTQKKRLASAPQSKIYYSTYPFLFIFF